MTDPPITEIRGYDVRGIIKCTAVLTGRGWDCWHIGFGDFHHNTDAEVTQWMRAVGCVKIERKQGAY